MTRVTDIKKGDEFRYDDGEVLWAALADARKHPERPGFVRVHVWDFKIDGDTYRVWPDDTTLPIDHPVTA